MPTHRPSPFMSRRDLDQHCWSWNEVTSSSVLQDWRNRLHLHEPLKYSKRSPLFAAHTREMFLMVDGIAGLFCGLPSTTSESLTYLAYPGDLINICSMHEND